MGKNYWPNVHSPFQKGPGPVGSFHLFVPGNFIIKVWTKVKELTKSGFLGYMSSVAPNAMSEGPYEGYTCISVHCEETKKNVVYKDLQRFCIDHLINKYSNYRSKPQQDILPGTIKNEVFYDEEETEGDEDEEDQNQAQISDEDLEEDSEENSESDGNLEEDEEVDVDDDTEEEVQEYQSMDESDFEEDSENSPNNEDEHESADEAEVIMENDDYDDDYRDYEWAFEVENSDYDDDDESE